MSITKLVYLNTSRTLKNKSEFKWLNGVMIQTNSVFNLLFNSVNCKHLNSFHSSANYSTNSLYSTQSFQLTKSIDLINFSSSNSHFNRKFNFETKNRLSNSFCSSFNAFKFDPHLFLKSKRYPISHLEFRRFLNHKVIHKLNQLDKKPIRKSKSFRKPTRSNSTEMKDLDETSFTYNEAIETLNSLQSNKIEIFDNEIASREQLRAKVNRTRRLLSQLKISQDDLNSMNIIHVSGTKGNISYHFFVR